MKMQTPVSLHEDALAKFFAHDPQTREIVADDALAALQSGVKAARECADQIASVVEALAADPTQSEAGRGAKARACALTLGAKAGHALDTARQAAAQTLADLQSEMALPLPADETELRMESEIRTRFAQLSHDARNAIIADAIATGQDKVVLAFLRAPGFVSGTFQADIDSRREEFLRKKYPKESDHTDRLRAALAVVEIGGKSLVAFVQHIADAPGASIAQAAADRAAKAVAAATKKDAA